MADDIDDYVPWTTGALGGAGGAILGRAMAGKTGKPIKKGKSNRQLRSDRFRNAGAVAGALGGYEAGRLASDPESVRADINRALAVREAVGLDDPNGSSVIYGATRVVPALLGARVIAKGIPLAKKAMSGKKTSDGALLKYAKNSGRDIAVGTVIAGAGNYWYPGERKK